MNIERKRVYHTTIHSSPTSKATKKVKSLDNDQNVSKENVELPKTTIKFQRNNEYDIHAASFDHPFIAISGIIGVGKTTLATALGKEMNLPVHYEPVINNEYLADFYKDMTKYGFPLQVYLLNKRYAQQQMIIWEGKGGIQDRSIYEDSIFAKMLMEDGKIETRDYNTYVSLFNNMSNFMRKPNLIVHLDCTPEESMERIKKRSRNCESSIPLDYLKKLNEAYQDFISKVSRVIPVIRVNWNKFHTTERMAATIKQEYEKMQNIVNVTL